MTKRFGFTLAEVLITLGIIGVVAAMTMPTLINQTNGAQYKAAYKKALSALSQAVTLNVALDDTSFADTVEGEAGKVTAGNGKTGDEKVDGTTVASLLNSRMNIVRYAGKTDLGYVLPTDITKAEVCYTDATKTTTTSCDTSGAVKEEVDLSPDTYLFFNDGSMFAFDSTSKACTADESGSNICAGIIDVNGAKGPNKLVKCDTGTGTSSKPCEVKSPTDIYKVVFYDQTVLPADDAAKAVLYGK